VIKNHIGGRYQLLSNMNLQENIRRVLKEETEKFDKVEHFVKTANTLFSKLKFKAVKRVEFDYDEMMNGYQINIFFDRQYAIDNPKSFNKVKQEAIKEIGSIITTFFPFKFYIYLHYD
jgi:hypothetical protein